MVSDADRARLDALEKRIETAQTATVRKRDPKAESLSQGQLAWRMVIEMVAGLLIGFGIGYGLDRLLGTLPIFLVLMTFAGLAAGVKTMLRSAREVEKKRLAALQPSASDGKKED